MGPESVKTIAHAIREAKRVGIELGLVTSSSWNAGGTWVAPEHAGMGLYCSRQTVRGPLRFDEQLPLPEVPRNAVNLTSRLADDGRLAWAVPPGPWTILRFGCSNNGQGLAVPSPNSRGLAIDHFSAEATRMHFNYFIEKLRQELGPLERTALSTLYLCSYELRGAVWTPTFLDEFRRRRGYDMTPYLPALFGATFKKPELTERFDYDVTNAEVILTRMVARDGRIVLPDGMSYQLLVLPDRDDVDLEVLQKLERLVGDARATDGKRYCRTNIDGSLTGKVRWKDTPLWESGLLGPVRIFSP